MSPRSRQDFEPYHDVPTGGTSGEEPSIVTAILIVVALLLLIGAFLWTLSALNPWVTDFIPASEPGTDESGSSMAPLVYSQVPHSSASVSRN